MKGQEKKHSWATILEFRENVTGVLIIELSCCLKLRINTTSLEQNNERLTIKKADQESSLPTSGIANHNCFCSIKRLAALFLLRG